MDPQENRNVTIEDRIFQNLDTLEDYCFRFPEFEEAVIESGILVSGGAKTSMDTYWIVSELEYGDGDAELPYRLRHWRYGETLIEQD